MRGIYVEHEAITEVDKSYPDSLAFNAGLFGGAHAATQRIGSHYPIHCGAGFAEQ